MKTLYICAIALLLAACSDGDDPSAPGEKPSVLGDWIVVDVLVNKGAGNRIPAGFDRIVDRGQSYLSIDETRIWILNERGVGFRRELVADYTKEADELLINSMVYRLELKGDSMVLEGPSSRLELNRHDSIPDPESWIEEYEAIVTQKTTNNSSGDIAWDGEDLWISGGPSGKPIYRQDSETLTAFICEFTSANPSAIDFLGGFLWGNDGDTASLRLFDHVNEVVSSTIARVSPTIRFLAGEGRLLWCGSESDKTIHVYDINEDEVVAELPLGNSVSFGGGSMEGGRIYIASGGLVTVFEPQFIDGSPTGLFVRGAIELPGYDIHGVAHDGSMLWVNAQEIGSTDMWLHRIAPAVGGGL